MGNIMVHFAFSMNFQRTTGLLGTVYDVTVRLSLMFCLLNDGGYAPTTLVPFHIKDTCI